MSNTVAKQLKDDVCPVCDGTGKFAMPKKVEIDVVEVKEKLVIGLFEKGYSYRQIQKALDYKSVRSIGHIIEKYKSKK